MPSSGEDRVSRRAAARRRGRCAGSGAAPEPLDPLAQKRRLPVLG